jgi:stage II sporulation protein AA (anti-sigma F factor antagonist)
MSRDGASGLEVGLETRDGLVAITVVGDVDLDNFERLAAALRDDSLDGARTVVLDLSGVPFMDSSGLKAMLVASQRLGDRLALVIDPDSAVLRLLEIAEVSNRFAVHDSVEAAAGAGAAIPE